MAAVCSVCTSECGGNRRRIQAAVPGLGRRQDEGEMTMRRGKDGRGGKGAAHSPAAAALAANCKQGQQHKAEVQQEVESGGARRR